MKHRYEILKDDKVLTVREYGELDKELFTLLCEEKYDLPRIFAALDEGLDSVISALRSRNFYPTRYAAEKLAIAVAEVCRAKDSSGLEFVLDDTEIFSDIQDPTDVLEEFDEANDAEGNDLEELLADDDKLKSTKGTFRVADAEEFEEEDP
jgi:hypothetical protein